MRLLLAAPFLILLVAFALSNTAPVRLGLWPTDWSVEMPLSVAMLGAAGVTFLLGAVLVWLSELARHRRLRHAEQTVKLLEERLRATKAGAGASALPPPT